MSIRVFAINPGSTSTKIALFDGDACLFSKNVAHDAEELAQYSDMPAQLPYRRDMILKILDENGISLEGVDVFVGRGGGLLLYCRQMKNGTGSDSGNTRRRLRYGTERTTVSTDSGALSPRSRPV